MRKGRAKKRIILPDPKFNDITVTKFVNNLMLDGKKTTAFSVFYDAMTIVEEKKSSEEETALQVFIKALENSTPMVEIKSRRIGGATFQVPVMIRAERKSSMAMKWLISYARKRNEKSMSQRLAYEILAAHKLEGATIKKKTEVHRMAEANKAFSNFKF